MVPEPEVAVVFVIFTPATLPLTASFFDANGTEYQKSALITPNWNGTVDRMKISTATGASEITLTANDGDGGTITLGSTSYTITKDLTVNATFVDPNTSKTTSITETFFIVSDGRDGTNARSVRLTTDAQVFVEALDGTITPSSITFTAVKQNVSGSLTFNTDPSVTLTGTGDSRTLSSANFGSNNAVVLSVSASEDGEFTDEVRVVRVKEGTDGLTLISSNPAHTLPASSSGEVLSYANSGTTLSLFEGATQLDYDNAGTTAGHWTVATSQSPSSTITVGTITESTNDAVVGVHSAMVNGTDTVAITYTITGKRLNGDAISLTSVQTLTKSKEGLDAVQVTNDNSNHTFTCNTSGTPVSFVGSGTEIRVFEGITALTFTTGTVYAKWPGAMGNSLKVQIQGPTSFNLTGQFDAAPTGNERHILVTDEDGVITGTAGTVLERYAFVSSSSSATNADGSTNYQKSVINRGSNYVRVNSALDSNASLSFAGGVETTVTTTETLLALDAFNDKDTISVDFMIAPGQASATDQETVVDDMVATAGTTRKDCIVVTSPASASVVGNADPVTATIADTNDYTYSSYLFVDNNWLKVYDKFNDKYINIPAAGSTAGIMAASDAEAAPWFSPAGSRRGAYLGVTSLAYTPTKAQRDTLYKAGINPIANLPGQGILLYGDKTHMNRPSAFDRINVRRLFNVVERAVALAARNTLFELNDEFTRAQFKNLVEPFLRDVQGRRGIYDFAVVCDGTNNTGEVIDRNEFIADIYIKPAKSINFIQLNFVAVRTGVEFSEIIGKF